LGHHRLSTKISPTINSSSGNWPENLLPKPSKEMIIATAFNRNHPQNLEGGIIEEKFQTEYVVDRTNTFGQAFMGLSLGCAKCHDHKIDPLSQQNYYEIFSFSTT